MAKKIVLETAGFDFTNKVLMLFQTRKTYRKEKLVLSEMLLKSGVQTGVFVRRLLQSTNLQEKTDLVKQSLVELERAMYLAYLMEYNAIYKASHIKEVISFGKALKEELTAMFKELLNLAKPKPIPVPTNLELDEMEPFVDEDGFDEVYDETVEE